MVTKEGILVQSCTGEVLFGECPENYTGLSGVLWRENGEFFLRTYRNGEEISPTAESLACAGKMLWDQGVRECPVPVKSPKKERKILNKTVFVLKVGEKIAIRRRPEDGLLAGMWEFYSIDEALSEKEAKKRLEAEGFAPEKLISLGKAKHIFTHLEWHMTGFLVECAEEKEGFVWKSFEEIDASYAIPSALQKMKQKAKEKV